MLFYKVDLSDVMMLCDVMRRDTPSNARSIQVGGELIDNAVGRRWRVR